jgi:hypothetical protein
MNLDLSVKCKLIGICGHAGSGKDTVGKYLVDTRDNTYKLAFADALKQAVRQMFGIEEDHLYETSLKEIPDPFWGVSPRQMAQFFGTEMVRETIGKLIPEVGDKFWIHRMVQKLNGFGEHLEYDGDDVVVITDVRFQNEYDWIVSQGGIIIHLTRTGADGTVGIPGHASEGSIHFHAPIQTFLIHNNSTLEYLHETVDNIVTSQNLYPFSNPDAF